MIVIDRLFKRFDDFVALGPLDITITDERIVTVIGPSGCGKSTLLRLLAGLETPSNGRAQLDGSSIDGPRPDVTVAFQDPRLMPWLDVARNVGFGAWDRPRAERREAVSAMLERVGLSSFASALPKQLSGGMAQRAGLARALVGRPRLLLLDEPFSALDPLTRLRLQDYLRHLVSDEDLNVVLITHDMDEAVVLSDRIIVLDGPPARVRRDIQVDLPFPRDRASPEFQRIKRLLMSDLLPAGSAATPETAA